MLTCNHRTPLRVIRMEPSHEASTCRARGVAAVAEGEENKAKRRAIGNAKAKRVVIAFEGEGRMALGFGGRNEF
jgi:hypothetical protein